LTCGDGALSAGGWQRGPRMARILVSDCPPDRRNAQMRLVCGTSGVAEVESKKAWPYLENGTFAKKRFAQMYPEIAAECRTTVGGPRHGPDQGEVPHRVRGVLRPCAARAQEGAVMALTTLTERLQQRAANVVSVDLFPAALRQVPPKVRKCTRRSGACKTAASPVVSCAPR
jgi:hypothetical protein